MLLLPAAFAEVLSVDPEATPKPIKITVEGLPDSKPTSLTTQKDVFFKNELFKPAATQVPVAEIRKMAETKKMPDSQVTEGEIIDAIIMKLSDMEDELKRQKTVNNAMLGGLAVLLALAILLLLRKRKK